MRLTTCYRLQPETFEKLKVFDKKAYFLKVNGDVAEAQKNAFNKLGQLEDIEDELGIDLIALFKALKNGVYTRQYEKVEVCCIGLGGLIIEKETENEPIRDLFYYYEYGKTWALTKEELEK